MNDDVKNTILSVFEASLEAQLRAVRRLRQPEAGSDQARHRKGLSQVDMALHTQKGTLAAARLPDPGAYPDPLRHNGGSRKPGFLADQEGGSRRPLPASR